MGDPPVRAGEIGIAEHGADVARSAVGIEEQAGGGRQIVEEVDVGLGLVEEGLVDHEPLGGDPDRRCEHLGQRHRAVALERLGPALAPCPGTPAESPLYRASLNGSGAPFSKNESGRIAAGAVSR